MKVRILSGNQKGAVLDQPQLEAEANISTGFAELYDPKKDQSELNKKVSGVPDMSPKKAAKLVDESPSAKPEKGKTGRASPKKAARKK
jgi:hypothetical protein